MPKILNELGLAFGSYFRDSEYVIVAFPKHSKTSIKKLPFGLIAYFRGP